MSTISSPASTWPTVAATSAKNGDHRNSCFETEWAEFLAPLIAKRLGQCPLAAKLDPRLQRCFLYQSDELDLLVHAIGVGEHWKRLGWITSMIWSLGLSSNWFLKDKMIISCLTSLQRIEIFSLNNCSLLAAAYKKCSKIEGTTSCQFLMTLMMDDDISKHLQIIESGLEEGGDEDHGDL
ncbi:hypothetical protein ACJX0J_039141 [Zea mays]